MKDKRQRMAMPWPFAMCTDPALATTLLAAAAGTLPPPPYHGAPALPPAAHLVPGYPAAAAAAYYAARYTPYPTTTSSLLHRPHPRTASGYPSHPHLLQPHPTLPPLHLPGLGVPNIGNAAFQVAGPPTNAATTTYRPTMLPELSPVHSDASSDCDCAPTPTAHQQHHQAQQHRSQQHQQHQLPSHEKSTPPPTSLSQISSQISPQTPTHLKLPTGLTLAGLPAQIQTIQNAYAGVMTPPSVQATKIEPPKLFQPYKSDIPERA